MRSRADENAILRAMPSGVRTALEPELTAGDFGPNTLFYAPGAPIEQVHFPLDGVLSVMTEMADGSAVETATIGREGAAGLSAALTPIAAHGRTIGQTSGTVLSAPVSLLRSMAAESQALRELVARTVELTLSQAQQSVACNILHDVEERFCRWLLMCDDRVSGSRIDLTQEFLAIMLGVQRTTVSQVAAQLQAAGLIRYARGKITLLDRPGLQARSCECYDVIRRKMHTLLPAAANRLTPSSPSEAEEAKAKAS